MQIAGGGTPSLPSMLRPQQLASLLLARNPQSHPPFDSQLFDDFPSTMLKSIRHRYDHR